MAKVVRKPGPGREKLDALLVQLRDAHVRVGWLEGAQYESGVPAAYVAVIHENGVEEKGIPPRPMLKPTVDAHQEEWRALACQLGGTVARGELSLRQAMEQLGMKAAGHVRMTIGDLTKPALAEATVEARRRKKERGNPIGSLTKPLQETDYLHSSVTSEVTDGKAGGA